MTLPLLSRSSCALATYLPSSFGAMRIIVRTSVISSSGYVRLNKYACVCGYFRHRISASQQMA